MTITSLPYNASNLLKIRKTAINAGNSYYIEHAILATVRTLYN